MSLHSNCLNKILKSKKMNELCFIIVLIACSVSQTVSENILGCGGFVKSHVPIDFSKVEVKLLTKQGILKDKINCAPNNGYYFVPLYDKGEYILELDPPAGWSFTPTKVEFTVDGISDECSQGKDINFSFKGFGITGKVESLGAAQGPGGVEVHLISGKEVRKTTTQTGGDFFFTPVYPGKYVVKIFHPRWKMWKDSVEVVVAEGNTELPPKSLIILGYQVVGRVKDEGEPIKDAIIVLYSQTPNHDVKVDGCDTTPLPHLKSANKPVCHVRTNEVGVFTFGAIPFGKYYIAPYYNEQNIYYQPSSITFEVGHGSLQLHESFEIIGFNIKGRVLKSPNGKVLQNAKIYLNGKEITTTNKEGIYVLERLKAGVYNIRAVADGFLFKDLAIKVSPGSKLEDLTPFAYHVCGTVVSSKSHVITFSNVDEPTVVTTQSDANSGQFCENLTPGKYDVQVILDVQDKQKGIQFFPKVVTIEVLAEHKNTIVFSQLKATLSGKVQCLNKKDCTGLKAAIRPVGNVAERNEFIVNISENSYTISDIYPGEYDVSLSPNKLCWKSSKQTVNVNSITVEVPTFIQVGYSVIFVSSHETELSYKSPGQSKETIVKIAKGKNSLCLDKAGTYHFHLSSCHTYESNVVTYNTDGSTNEVSLNALKHKTILTIESNKKNGDVTAVINIEGVKVISPPLPFNKNNYEIMLFLKHDEKAVIEPQSEIMYFEPPILSIDGVNDCQNLGVQFRGVVGTVFKGKVTPALAGVLVTVESENSDALMTETDANGVYKFPPLDNTKEYKITAKKDSYVLVGPENGNFIAQKLAEIIIEVIDMDHTPLQGALLSLSGGDSYRSNLQTNEIGKITFHSLSPGDYFLRPMMKEYSFEPNSKIINVKEGQTVKVQLIGKRVAYSAYGQVTTLNREPEENIVVVATGTGNCSHFSEESTSESTGFFRIRGLQPYCLYDISVRSTVGGQETIERSAPRVIHLDKVVQDISGLQLVVFRPIAYLDLLVKVNARNPEHYKGLRLKVMSEPSDTVVYTGRVDTPLSSLVAEPNQGVLMQVPPIPVDGKTYLIYLESTIHSKVDFEAELVVANTSFKYIELDFIVRSHVVEQDIKQTSIWTLFVIFVIMLGVYNIDKVSLYCKEWLGGYFNELISVVNKKSTVVDYPADNDDIDQIVQSINAVKRKPKLKKL